VSEPASARTRILVATLQIVEEQGIDAVTHRAVAARAGVSPGSTTHHFSSRTDLLREAFRYYLREGEPMLHPRAADRAEGSEPAAQRIERLLSAVVDREFGEGFVRAEYELFLFACTDPELADDVRAWEARVVASVAELLESSGVSRPIVATRALMNMHRGYELERLLDPRLTTDDLRERLAIVLRGILSPD
jgi:TetR/AcrR family transcriptional regulator, regulator of biofilm formation and stress response